MISQQLMTVPWREFHRKTRQNVVALATVAVLSAGLTGAAWPDGGTYGPDRHASMVPAPAASHTAPAMRISPAGWENPAPPWAFPFDQPAEPGEGGNQALAVNTTDGSVAYSAEFDLVWADDGEPVATRNEAYAFANCTGCTAVAVGFQVVLILEQPDVIAPENHSAAVNYNCLDCHTQALASQLVLTVGRGLSDDGVEQLSELWDEIDGYGRNLQDVPPSEIQSRLEAYKAQITAIVQADPNATEDGSATSTETCNGESAVPSTLAPTQPA